MKASSKFALGCLMAALAAGSWGCQPEECDQGKDVRSAINRIRKAVSLAQEGEVDWRDAMEEIRGEVDALPRFRNEIEEAVERRFKSVERNCMESDVIEVSCCKEYGLIEKGFMSLCSWTLDAIPSAEARPGGGQSFQNKPSKPEPKPAPAPRRDDRPRWNDTPSRPSTQESNSDWSWPKREEKKPASTPPPPKPKVCVRTGTCMSSVCVRYDKKVERHPGYEQGMALARSLGDLHTHLLRLRKDIDALEPIEPYAERGNAVLRQIDSKLIQNGFAMYMRMGCGADSFSE